MPTTTRMTRRIYAPGSTPAAVTTTGPSTRGGLPSLAPPPPATSQCCCPACVGLECLDRTRFFSGQLLTEADLNNEQSYWLAKTRLHNRFLHGWGVVCGMQVVCSDCDGWVTVKPGYAIDPCGNDVIVCSDYAFNVVTEIQACCTPTKQTSNCAPLRSAPPDTCKDAEQKWCITIEYQEQPSRLVTPLIQAQPKTGSCSCGSGKGACGCGCGCGSKNGSSKSSSSQCTCSSTQTQTTAIPTGACEPTRVNEGFRMGIVAAPPMEERPTGPTPGTAAYQIEQCLKAVQQLIQQLPDISKMDPNSAFTAVCNFLVAVKRYFAATAVTHCQALDDLNQIVVPQPTPQNGDYIGQLEALLKQIAELVFIAALDCFCMALIPPCPPDPCDDRLYLAQVTVKSGKIVDICHYQCRKQLVTFHVLYYWLSLIGFDRFLRLLILGLERICCKEFTLEGLPFLSGRAAYQKENLSVSGLTDPSMANGVLATILSQRLGAALVNAAAPQARAVNLQQLAGQPTDTVNRTLLAQGFTAAQLNIQPVDADPSWTDEAVAAAAQLAPAAVSAGRPLTVYTKGNLVVGFDVTDPVDTRLDTMQAQLDRLDKQFQSMPGGTSGATPPKNTP